METNNNQEISNESTEIHKTTNALGLAVASLCLGIVSLILACCFPIAIILAIPGLTLGIIGIVRKQGGMAITGTVLSAIAIFLTLFSFLSFSPFSNHSYNKNPLSIFPSNPIYRTHKSEPTTPAVPEPKEALFYDIGEKIKINESSSEKYTVTLNAVTALKDKLTEADETFNNVIILDYTIENLSSKDNLYLSPWDFNVLDSEDIVGTVIPNSEIDNPIGIGETITKKIAFALDTESKFVTIVLHNIYGDEIAKWEVTLS